MAVGSAVVGGLGVATSVVEMIQGYNKEGDAKRGMKKLMANRPEPIDPYASLRPHTLGLNMAQDQSLRGMATQTQAASNAGVRGMGFIPQLARQNAMVGMQSAANLDQQQAGIDQMQARGQMMQQQQKIDYFNQEAAGYSNLYNAGAGEWTSGMSNLTNTLASGSSEGGAFANLFEKMGNKRFQPLV